MPWVRDTLFALLAVICVAATPTESDAEPLRAKFLGVTTILFDDGETAIMTDGFFSRPAFAEAFFLPIAPNQARIDNALAKAGVTRLAAVMTAHSHIDHAMDAPIVAAKTGAVLIGSESTANIARGLDFSEDRLRVIKGGETFTFGRFKITAIKSPHTTPGLPKGEIDKPLRPPTPIFNYKEGGSYSFLIEHDGQGILVNPSTNFAPGLLQGRKADVVFLGIATLGTRSDTFAKDYWREVVETTGAKLVIPIHWDNFFKPLDEPLQPFPLPVDDFEKSKEMLRTLAEADEVTVQMPRPFETIDLTAARP